MHFRAALSALLLAFTATNALPTNQATTGISLIAAGISLITSRAVNINFKTVSDDLVDEDSNPIADARAEFNEAMNHAINLASAALAMLEHGSESAIYNAFFGSSATNLETVRANFERIRDLFSPSNTMTIDVDLYSAPEGQSYAKSFPPTEGGNPTLSFVQSFWGLPPHECLVPPTRGTGTGQLASYTSRGTVILHELFHVIPTQPFSVQQEVFGPKPAMQLAEENPDRAAANADNYVFFAMASYYNFFATRNQAAASQSVAMPNPEGNLDEPLATPTFRGSVPGWWPSVHKGPGL